METTLISAAKVSLLPTRSFPMSQGQDFSQSDQNNHQLSSDERANATSTALALFQEGLRLVERGKYDQAISCYEQAMQIKPDSPEVCYHYGLVLSHLGRDKEALGYYNKALELKPDYPEALSDQANALIGLGRHKEALVSCDQAIKIDPQFTKAWFRRGLVLMRLNRRKDALLSCDKAIEIQPDSYEAWTMRGVVLSLSGRLKPALANFDKALEINPHYPKGWYNRSLMLLKLSRFEEALAGFTKALELSAECRETWYHQAWYGRGFVLARLNRYEEAIASFEKSLEVKPDYPAAALYKLICLILTGQIFKYLGDQPRRKQLFQDLISIVKGLKYSFLFAIAFIFAMNSSQALWGTLFKQAFSNLFSLALIGMILFELWKNRSGLNLVWRVYFRSGILTYIRAVCILTITLTTFAAVTPYIPSFLQVGWANLVFGSSKNIIFQPFDTIKEIQPAPSVNLPSNSADIEDRLPDDATQDIAPSSAEAPSSSSDSADTPEPKISTEQQNPVSDVKPKGATFNYAQILIILFWLLLIIMVPFWARLEEKLFRQGANTWKQIAFKSTLFGLIHILVGIPIYSGFILIVPGFLFACRYKYAHDRFFKKTDNEKLAQEVGVEASTADHAIYNAILITLLVVVMLLEV